MLTRFHNPDRPLGSVELILSTDKSLGDWKPSQKAAERLGLTDGTTLPVEKATFINIKEAFDRWLERAGAHLDNAAFFYFSGHGIWKSELFLLPEDARIASSTQGFDNLIDIQQTQVSMVNRRPSVQTFFVDACQEVILELLENPSTRPPGVSLCTPVNAVAINRDAWRFEGARPSRRAFGPADGPPFFTQELLACLERLGADSVKVANTWNVTTSSLKRALEAASRCREETDKDAKDIMFAAAAAGSSGFTATLCQIQDSPEVFVEVECRPAATMERANLFVVSGGKRMPRQKPSKSRWVTKVPQGNCLAGADFDATAALSSSTENFEARPPVHPVVLTVKPV
jgi:hypothetical protein